MIPTIMLFNSVEFFIFLPLVFLLYWFAANRSLKVRNFFILTASYVFYGWWEWRFLFLIALTSLSSYLSGITMDGIDATPLATEQKQTRRKWISGANIFINLGILVIFKYFNFFTENFSRLFKIFGFTLDWFTLDILLPVGISFYTFQALSYSIDVYKRKIRATHDPIAFFAYVAFFPQLVAGPIERAENLLPQFGKKRSFDYPRAIEGCRQILWGLFKKMVVADHCGPIVNNLFDNYQHQGGGALLLGGVFFAFQIYGDFSGYSDIALGTAKLFGFDLMKNFNYPYFSRSIAEFWRRWHISLSTWFRDYVYIPLGGSRGPKSRQIRNTFIIFLLSGFWHGANWTFICWGVYHACLFLPLLLFNKNRKYTNTVAPGRWLPSFREAIRIIFTFLWVVIGWIIFRAENIEQAIGYLSRMFGSLTDFSFSEVGHKTEAIVFILLLLVVEWTQRDRSYTLQIDGLVKYRWMRWGIYYLILYTITQLGAAKTAFIYFQF